MCTSKPRLAIFTSPTAPFVPPKVRWKRWAHSIWCPLPATFHRNDERTSARSSRCLPHVRKRVLRAMGHVLGPHQRKAFEAIRDCRTAALGGHVEYVEQCDTCGHRVISYNSCRDRHCPKCQALARAKWLAERETELLPVPYFHVVLTLPRQIGGLALQNGREIYNILFRAVSETLLTIAADPR